MAETTCWTLIEAAAEGAGDGREEFARRYGAIVEAYVGARWRGSPLLAEAEDAVQDVLLECLREQGAIAKAELRRSGGFRAYLFGVTRNVTRRIEERLARRRHAPMPSGADSWLPDHADESLGGAFDRAWAKSLVREAARQLDAGAARSDEGARRRVALLRERFQGGKPIREIARDWQVDAAQLHTQFARARKEFAASLRAVVAFHYPEDPSAVERECRAVLMAVSS